MDALPRTVGEILMPLDVLHPVLTALFLCVCLWSVRILFRRTKSI
jgi:hypothetical protein